jgi:DNA-binding MarR family transcriptional regulator
MDHDCKSDSLTQKLLDGLDRLSTALQVDRRRSAEGLHLNATQSAILRLLGTRAPAGLRVGEIAEHLVVRQPTATDSINALERKGFVRRRPVEDDARATTVHLVSPVSPELSIALSATAAIADLSDQERVQLLRLVIKMIRSLQLRGAIPPQRLCVSCKYFRPNVHPDAQAPHHCAFVDAAFGDAALRLDCADHQAASAADQASHWTAFTQHTA